MTAGGRVAHFTAMALACVALTGFPTRLAAADGPRQPTFATPEDAVSALTKAVKAGKLDELLGILGPGGQQLVDSSDPTTGRRNREVFAIAVAEGWRLENHGADGKTLVVGHEEWPFPVPIVKSANGWRFDTAAGKEEVLARRIGRNELAVIQICGTYVDAQRLYARRPHDGQPAGLYARQFRSDAGRQNGLYWPVAKGEKRSPLGDLVALAAEEGTNLPLDRPPAPFHGYYFRILTAQGAAAPGGARTYIDGDRMSGGFALVAWPAAYDATGVMTFVVNQDGVVHQKDLGPATDRTARAMRHYDPDGSWANVH